MTRYRLIVSRLQRAERDVDADDRDQARQMAEDELRRLYAEIAGWQTIATDAHVVPTCTETIRPTVEPSGVEPYLLRVAAAAEYLGISRTSLYQLIKSGEMETVTIGRRHFVSRDQLQLFVTTATRGPDLS